MYNYAIYCVVGIIVIIISGITNLRVVDDITNEYSIEHNIKYTIEPQEPDIYERDMREESLRIKADTTQRRDKEVTDADIDALSKMVWGEARGLSISEMKLTVWTALQRVDDPRWPDTIQGVLRQTNQFHGYNSRHPVCPKIRAVVFDTVCAWLDGENPLTLEPYALSTPYFFFAARQHQGRMHNFFRENYSR